MSNWEVCYKCVFFEYDRYTEEYCCNLNLISNKPNPDCAWKSRQPMYRKYDHDWRLQRELEQVCRENPCIFRATLSDVYNIKCREANHD